MGDSEAGEIGGEKIPEKQGSENTGRQTRNNAPDEHVIVMLPVWMGAEVGHDRFSCCVAETLRSPNSTISVTNPQAWCLDRSYRRDI